MTRASSVRSMKSDAGASSEKAAHTRPMLPQTSSPRRVLQGLPPLTVRASTKAVALQCIVPSIRADARDAPDAAQRQMDREEQEAEAEALAHLVAEPRNLSDDLDAVGPDIGPDSTEDDILDCVMQARRSSHCR